MTFDELSFDQCVIWTNKAGTRIPARVTDILPSHNEAQIRVTHEGGLQHLRVRPETLEADTAATDARRCACPVWDARDCLTLRYQLPRNYFLDALGIDEVCECACHTSDENPYYQPYDDDDDD